MKELLGGLLLALLIACNTANPGGNASPPWALGEQPNFSGKITYWEKADAIAPGEGGIFATMYGTGDPEGTLIGVGSIKVDGSFSFGLYKSAYSAGGGLPVAQVLCAGLSASNPQQKIANVDLMEVLSLYQDGVHARPGGGILISTAHPVPASAPLYTFIYASQDGSLKGSCDVGDDAGLTPFDLDLRKGWNSIQRDKSGFKTAAIPAGAKWYLINPLTAAQ